MKKVLLLLLISFLFISCDSDTTFRSSVPTYPVQLDINILAEYPGFVTANGFQTMTFTEQRFVQDYLGYLGLVVWVGMDEQYHAADLCCPNCVYKNGRVEIDGIFAKCPICGEEYDLSFGLASPTKGISKESLRQYTTSYDNYTGILKIRHSLK